MNKLGHCTVAFWTSLATGAIICASTAWGENVSWLPKGSSYREGPVEFTTRLEPLCAERAEAPHRKMSRLDVVHIHASRLQNAEGNDETVPLGMDQ